MSVLLGGLTSFAQGWLPAAAAPFANSASGWTLLTVLLVAWARLAPRLSAVLGAVSFVLLVLGYTWAAGLRGLTYSPVLFTVVGLIVGPPVGLATAWLRSAGVRAASGTAALAGIAVGEGVYGLTEVADTTHPAYWVVIAVVGLGLLILMLMRRLRGAAPIAVAVLGTVAVAVAFVVAYSSLGGAAQA